MCHAVAGAHGVTQHPGEVFDDFISRSMAETALQFVEVINVEQCDRQRLGAAGGDADLVFEGVIEAVAVEGAGEAVDA